MILSQANAQRIAEENSRAIGRDVNIMDENGVIVASTDRARVGTVHEGARRLLREGLDLLAVCSGDEFPGSQEGVNLPVTLHGEVAGVIGISGPPSEVAVFGSIIRRMTEMQLELLHRQEQEEQLEQARGLFWEYLLFSEAVDADEAALRGKLLGIDPGLERTAVELCPLRGTERASELECSQVLQFARRQLRGEAQAFCTTLHRHVLLFLPGGEDAAAETVRALGEEMKYRLPLRLCGGVGTSARGAAELRRSYREAKGACAEAMLSGTPRITRFSDVSLDMLLESVPERLRRQLTEKLLGACAAEDRAEALETIEAWFACNGSSDRAAQRLNVHKNTFLYRVNKVRRLTGQSLRDPRESAMLYCCLRFAAEAK